jgi:hypothetical protein
MAAPCQLHARVSWQGQGDSPNDVVAGAGSRLGDAGGALATTGIPAVAAPPRALTFRGRARRRAHGGWICEAGWRSEGAPRA